MELSELFGKLQGLGVRPGQDGAKIVIETPNEPYFMLVSDKSASGFMLYGLPVWIDLLLPKGTIQIVVDDKIMWQGIDPDLA